MSVFKREMERERERERKKGNDLKIYSANRINERVSARTRDDI